MIKKWQPRVSLGYAGLFFISEAPSFLSHALQQIPQRRIPLGHMVVRHHLGDHVLAADENDHCLSSRDGGIEKITCQEHLRRRAHGNDDDGILYR